MKLVSSLLKQINGMFILIINYIAINISIYRYVVNYICKFSRNKIMKSQCNHILAVMVTIIIIISCSPVKKVTKVGIEEIIVNSSASWTVEECEAIINYSSCSNIEDYWSNDLAMTLSTYDVFINAVRLDKTSIQALVRKEAILKRISHKDYLDRLRLYLEDYTNYMYDTTTGNVVKKNISEDSLKGLSFKIRFNNATDPYRPIDIEDGYEYFFLENNRGEFSRVIEISGDYADHHFFLADYLNVIVTFSRFTDSGKALFVNNSYEEGYKLVFNALDSDPIIIDWKVSQK